MNNTEKLLRAFIEASGFEIDEVRTNHSFVKLGDLDKTPYPDTITITDYKVTKKVTVTPMVDAWVKSSIDRGTFR